MFSLKDTGKLLLCIYAKTGHQKTSKHRLSVSIPYLQYPGKPNLTIVHNKIWMLQIIIALYNQPDENKIKPHVGLETEIS